MQKSSSFQIYNASAGSGKTFTLVKEYLKILLESSNAFKFQQILAVTFTNKAAGEMKERVIKNLNEFAQGKTNNMQNVICSETGIPDTLIKTRAQNILSALLQNYSAFSVTTIDSFTHKLIRTFAYDLDLPLNFDVEMDAQTLLSEAVDVVISKIGSDKQLTNLLVSYAIDKLNDDKSWDFSHELKSFASIILNENHAEHLKNLNKTDIQEFTNIKKQLKKENNAIAEKYIEIGQKGSQLIKSQQLAIGDFANGGDLPNHFLKLKRFINLNVNDLKFEGRLNSIIEDGKKLYSAKCQSFQQQCIENISDELVQLYFQSKELYVSNYGRYIFNDLIINGLVPLAVLSYINYALNEIKTENNILLNAEFNNLISNSIKNEPAPFIYERLGEKYRYYFIDEMQDTSLLQWQNLIPLIDNAISTENEFGEKGRLLLVGDPKQSIYRWRGGKAEQFIGLSNSNTENAGNPFYVEKTVLNLNTNYRSFSEIIDFNNNFFTFSADFLNNAAYKQLFKSQNNQQFNKNLGGYVELSFIEINIADDEKELLYPKKVLEIIQNLDKTFSKNEVCVIVRTKKQGVAVANYLTENNVDIISSETLLLKNNDLVNFVINFLYFIENPSNNEVKIKLLYFLHEFINPNIEKHQFLEEFIRLPKIDFFEKLKQFNIFFNYNEFIQIPFYESIEYIIGSFKLTQKSNAALQFFLDVVFEYQQKKQASVLGLLEYWEQKKENLSVVAPETEAAVNIITIHKAKGLEFPVVIYPYDLNIYKQIEPKVWLNYPNANQIKSVLVNYSDKLKYIGEEGKYLHQQRREELELDNFNLLYVALTRPVEQLYIVTNKNKNPKKDNSITSFSGLFTAYLKHLGIWASNQLTYGFGNKQRCRVEKDILKKSKIQASFITNSWKNHQINIVSKSSVLWDTTQGEAISYGNLIHEMLSKIYSDSDIDEVTNQYLYKGLINNKTYKKVVNTLKAIVNHPKLKPYFLNNYKNNIYNEREFVTNEGQILIPDRLIINNKKVTIIDYKTGLPNPKHHQQILTYAKTLEALKLSVNKMLLVYIKDEIIVEEL